MGSSKVIGHLPDGTPISSAIVKTPLRCRVVIDGVNIAGDDQANRKFHGGPDKVVYAYAVEDTQWWAGELVRPQLGFACFGQNFDVYGLDLRRTFIGDILRVGDVPFESPSRNTCYKLERMMGMRDFCGCSRGPSGRAFICGY